MKLPVNEIFQSVQGEGLLQGQTSVFLRTALCNVNCPMCDTDYHHGVWISVTDIVQAIKGSYSGTKAGKPVRHLVVTGGEPYIHPGMQEFLEEMAHLPDWHITVETSGTIVPPVISNVDLLSISPKFCSLRPAESSHLDLDAMLLSFQRIVGMRPKPIAGNVQVKLVWNGSPEDIPNFLPPLIKQLEDLYIPVFFQPMTKGPEFSLYSYTKEFPRIAKAVLDRFGPYPRVLPQMHKFYNWR